MPLLYRNRLRCTLKSNLQNSLSQGIIADLNDNSELNKSIDQCDQEFESISLNEIVIGRG